MVVLNSVGKGKGREPDGRYIEVSRGRGIAGWIDKGPGGPGIRRGNCKCHGPLARDIRHKHGPQITL